MTDNTQGLEDILDTLAEKSADSDSRLGYVDAYVFAQEAKQALTSLIKELVIPARSGREYDLADPTGSPLGERVDNRRFKSGGTMDYIDGLNSGYNRAIDEFEQNLLKELEGKE